MKTIIPLASGGYLVTEADPELVMTVLILFGAGIAAGHDYGFSFDLLPIDMTLVIYDCLG